MKVLEKHTEHVTYETYYVMLDDGYNLWYRETLNSDGAVVMTALVDEDGIDITADFIEFYSKEVFDQIEEMCNSYLEKGPLFYQH